MSKKILSIFIVVFAILPSLALAGAAFQVKIAPGLDVTFGNVSNLSKNCKVIQQYRNEVFVSCDVMFNNGTATFPILNSQKNVVAFLDIKDPFLWSAHAQVRMPGAYSYSSQCTVDGSCETAGPISEFYLLGKTAESRDIGQESTILVKHL